MKQNLNSEEKVNDEEKLAKGEEKVNDEEKDNQSDFVKNKGLIFTDLIVQRKSFEFSDKSTGKKKKGYNYCLKSLIRNKPCIVYLAPVTVSKDVKDLGGYVLFDIIFGDDEFVDFCVAPYKLTNVKTGEVNEGYSYFICSVDEDGDVLDAKVRPESPSDKSMLDYLIRKFLRSKKESEEKSDIN